MAETNIVYPVIIKKDGDTYLVYVPDFDGMTEGTSLANAIEMARDYIGLACLEFDDRKEALPKMSTAEQAKMLAKEKADDEEQAAAGRGIRRGSYLLSKNCLEHIRDIAGRRTRKRSLSGLCRDAE